MEELWRPIPDCEDYEVSELGSVRTWRPPGNDLRGGRRMTAPRPIPVHRDPSGVPYVLLPAGDRFRRRSVARVVEEVFGTSIRGDSESVTIGQLAEIAGMSRSTLRRAIDAGLLTGVGIWRTPGGHNRIPRTSIAGAVAKLRQEVHA